MERKLDYRKYYRTAPIDFKAGDWVPVKAVCVLGHDQDFTIYIGPADKSDEEIAMFGDKLVADRGEKAGDALFPSIASGRYYRR